MRSRGAQQEYLPVVVNDTAREAAETIDVALFTAADGGQLGATSTER